MFVRGNFTFLNIFYQYCCNYFGVGYNKSMGTNNKKLNRFEIELQQGIESLMKKHRVKFSVFLPVLRNDMPDDKASNEYKNKHKAEYLKQLRASYSVEEVVKMLGVLRYNLIFSKDKMRFELEPDCVTDVKVKYTELMAACKMLGINIEWVENTDRTNDNGQKP